MTHYRVTSWDIIDSTPGDPWTCPVARAINRKHRWPLRACVMGDEIELEIFRLWTVKRAKAPAVVSSFIARYDLAKPITSFDFELEW